MFGALKRGFRSTASLILVRNVVDVLQPKRLLAASRGFLAAARLSCIVLCFDCALILYAFIFCCFGLINDGWIASKLSWVWRTDGLSSDRGTAGRYLTILMNWVYRVVDAGWKADVFSWEKYLSEQNAQPAPAEVFTTVGIFPATFWLFSLSLSLSLCDFHIGNRVGS